MQSIRFSHQALVLIVSASTFGACSSSVSTPTPIPPAAGPLSPTDRAVPFGPGYAYVADDSNPGHVYVYQLPLSVHSQPLWAIEANGPGSTGFAGRQTFILVGGPRGEKREGVLVWRKKAGRVSFLLRTRLLPEMLEVDSRGDIFQGQTYTAGTYSAFQINVFMQPITKESTPAFSMSTAINHIGSQSTRGMAFDREGNLWVKDDDNQTMDKYIPPFSASSMPKLRFPKGSGAPYGSMIFDANDMMYVTNGSGVDVYKPPFTKYTKKAFTIQVPGTTISLAVDKAGDLYSTTQQEKIYVYAPPFSASSEPKVRLRVPGRPTSPFIAIKQ